MIEIKAEVLPLIIKIHRKKSGLSQKALAELAGLGKNVIFDIEKGKETVQMNTLLKVLNVLNIKLMADGPFVPEAGGNNDA